MNPQTGPDPKAGLLTSIRLAHLSDIHISVPHPGWQMRDLLTKRLTGWINLRLLGRGRRFRRGEEILAVLMTELHRLRPDRVIFSGDATALSFEREFQRAAILLGLTQGEHLPGLAVPGNHDYYITRAAQSGLFERYFAPWLQGERIGEALYPFAQRAGPFWLVGVNAGVPNWLPWDAGGEVGPDQLGRLEVLLSQLSPGPRILVIHFPIYQAQGKKEIHSRNLGDLDQVLALAARGGVCLWLHGHRHDAYFHPASDQIPFPVICAGSATHRDRWSYHLYTITGPRLLGVKRTFHPEEGIFRDAGSFELTLPLV
jgi:3',5'-cyclic AMP phosphodiesterase CpdA